MTTPLASCLTWAAELVASYLPVVASAPILHGDRAALVFVGLAPETASADAARAAIDAAAQLCDRHASGLPEGYTAEADGRTGRVRVLRHEVVALERELYDRSDEPTAGDRWADIEATARAEEQRLLDAIAADRAAGRSPGGKGGLYWRARAT